MLTLPTFCRLFCTLPSHAIGNYALIGSQLVILKMQLYKRLTLFRFLYFPISWSFISKLGRVYLQNPDSYKKAWKLLKVCILHSSYLIFIPIIQYMIIEQLVLLRQLINKFIALQGADAVLVPGGFGDRGVEGKILAAKYARENLVPYLGICLGMQTAVIEFARSVLGLKNANSTEFDPNTKNPCVIFMPEVSYDTIIWACFIYYSWVILFFIVLSNLMMVSYNRAQRRTWEALCVSDQGGHTSSAHPVNPRNCKFLHLRSPPFPL